MSVSSNLTVQQLYKNLSTALRSAEHLYKGFTITDVSIEKKLRKSNRENSGTYYNNATSDDNFVSTIFIPDDVLEQFFIKSQKQDFESTMYDFTIDSVFIPRGGNIVINVSSIRESGVSDRELLNRRLSNYLKQIGYTPSSTLKRPLPPLITNVLAITSAGSGIADDIFSNIGIKRESINIVKCSSSQEIADTIQSSSALYDIVVLYRGGHEDRNMDMFSHERVIDACINSSVPIWVALGHEADRPFIYALADYESSTPSAFAQDVALHNDSALSRYNTLIQSIKLNLEYLYSKKTDEVSLMLGNIEKNSALLISSLESFNSNIVYSIEKTFNALLKEKNNNVKSIIKSIDSNVNVIINMEKKEKKHEEEKKEIKRKNKVMVITALVVVTVIIGAIILVLRR